MNIAERVPPPFVIDQKRCTFCAGCAAVCPVMAISIEDSSSSIGEACTGCGRCQLFCPVTAIAKRAP